MEKDAKQSKKQVKSALGSRKKGRKKDVSMNDSHTEKAKADDDDMGEPEFWVPPVGSRLDLDDGKYRWDPQTNLVDEADDGSGLETSPCVNTVVERRKDRSTSALTALSSLDNSVDFDVDAKR
ncbi:hypothetical protein BHM03_00010906 [Ensete ventricosum]|nr:hypothetical protein BHM03_00010906 [Ensete ventricosum]